MHQQDINQYIIQFSYLGIFLWFAIVEQLTPVPEEVSLMSLGYLCMHSSLNIYLSMTVSMLALTVADNLFFYLALSGNKFIHRFTRKVESKVMDKIKSGLQKHAVKTLLLTALIPKLRFLSPVIAAGSGIRWKLFFLVNLAATGFYTVFYFLMGVLFHHQLESLLKEFRQARHIIFISVMLLASVLIMIRLNKSLLKKK